MYNDRLWLVPALFFDMAETLGFALVVGDVRAAVLGLVRGSVSQVVTQHACGYQVSTSPLPTAGIWLLLNSMLLKLFHY